MTDADSLARRSAQALGWSWAGALLRALLQFGLQIVLARLLGPEAFGQAAAVLLVIGLGGLLAEAGLASALVQREQLDADDAGRALGAVAVAALVVAALIGVTAQPLARLLGDEGMMPLVVAAAVIVPLQAFTSLPPALLQRRLAMKRLQAIQVLGYLVGYGGAGVGLAMAGAGAWSLLAAFALHALVVGVLAWAGTDQVSWRPRWSGGDNLRAYGARITLANLVNWGAESIDRLVVARVWGAAALGPYAAAAALARAPVALLVTSAQPVAFAASARLQGEHDRLARGYLAMLSLALLFAVPLAVAMAWFAQTIVGLLYGASWSAATAPFAWLSLSVPFFVVFALTGPLLRGVDAVGREARVQGAVLIGLAAVLAGPWLLGVQQPLWAVAAWVLLATTLRALGLTHALAQRIALPWHAPWRAWRGGGVLGLEVVLIAALVQAWVTHELAALALTVLLVPIAAAASLRWQGAALFGRELVLALSNRRADSRVAAALCRWARLTG